MKHLAAALSLAGLACQAVAADAATAADTVLASPRWELFVARVQEQALRPAKPEALAAACRRALAAEGAAVAEDPIDRCIAAALAAEDAGSDHVSAAQFKRERELQRRPYVGIGLELVPKKPGEALRVVTPFEGAPGARAGVRPRDLITAIDGEELLPLDMDETLARLRGEPGSRITLTLRREGEPAPVVLTMAREPVRLLTVRQREVAPDVAYLRINQFQDGTASEFVRKLDGLADAAGAVTAKGLVLDLRGNQGGLLSGVAEVAGLFTEPSAPVLLLRKRDATDPLTPRDLARGPVPRLRVAGPWLRQVPVVVLVDRRTASGAEALAQCLREMAGARLVGSGTAGVAHVRTSLLLAGESRLNLVTAEMTSPLGRSWTGTGLVPDVTAVQELEAGDYGDAQDGPLQQALATVRGLPPRTLVEGAYQATPTLPTLSTPIVVPTVVPLPPRRAAEGGGGRSRGP